MPRTSWAIWSSGNGEYQELNRPAAEQEANRLAAAFLMPRSSVLAQELRDASAARSCRPN